MLSAEDKRLFSDRSGDIWRILGVRREDGGNRLQDLLTQFQAMQAKVDALDAAVKVLQARP